MTKTILIFGIVIALCAAVSGQDNSTADTAANTAATTAPAPAAAPADSAASAPAAVAAVDTAKVAAADTAAAATTATATVTATDTAATSAAVADTAAASAATATPTLSIATDPEGAAVVVNGKDYGASPVTITDLSPGEHSLELSLPGHFRRRATIRLDSADTRLRFELSRPVSIFITGTPQGADVSVNGAKAGTLPLLLERQRPGKYKISVTADGHAQVDTAVNAASGANDTVSVTLLPKPAPDMRHDKTAAASVTAADGYSQISDGDKINNSKKGKGKVSRQTETLLAAFILFIVVMVAIERSAY